jgi:chemotaxis protein methyltransferase CheR
MVYETCGIVFKESNLAVLISRLSSKLKEKKMTQREYFELLKKDKQELSSFIDFVTTNFTSFFRNPKQFEMLLEDILPIYAKRNASTKNIKFWSAGCSSGEEPYTVAMVVEEFFEKNNLKDWTYSITGSDISLESLFIAKAAKFPEKSVEKIEKIYLDKYFNSVSGAYIVKDSLKKNIRFDYHNLIYDNGIRDVDITFCRNVLIYFDEDIQRRVIANIYLGMKPETHLFIGHSESLIGIFDGFKPQSYPKGIVYVKQ